MGKLTAPQIDFLKRETKNLSAQDFRAVADRYGVPIKGKSMLCCLHDDRHFGNCYMRPDGRTAYCYSCCKTIDGVSIVMAKEGLDYPNAMKRLWCDVLGNDLPDADDGERDKLPLSSNELKFIGLRGCFAGSLLLPYNKCEKNEDVSGAQYGSYEPEGGCLVAKSVRRPALGKLYKTNKVFVLRLMRGKAEETVRYYEDLKRDLKNPNTEIGSVAGEDKEFSSMIERKLKKAYSIRKKLEGSR